MKKRVLITYATYGSGHKTVANYIYNYLIKKGDYEIEIIDLMDYENTIGYISKKAFERNFKHRYSNYIFTFNYKLFDSKLMTKPYKLATKAIFKNKNLRDEIVSFNPDLVISTHFFGNILISMLNKKGLTNAKIISIITDYVSHEMWLKDEEDINAFIVSNDIVKNELISHNINKDKIYSFGIPISCEFSTVPDVTKIKNKYHVNNCKLTFLFFAGGSLGSSYTYNYIKKLAMSNYDINIIFVCGKNDKLKKKVDKLVKDNDYKNIRVLGFSNEVNYLLAISDVVITKPGGLSITECLEMKKPMLLINGNGGNEIYNARFVSKNGYGIKCSNHWRLNHVVKYLVKYPSNIKKMKDNLDKYDVNRSVDKIYSLSKKLLK